MKEEQTADPCERHDERHERNESLMKRNEENVQEDSSCPQEHPHRNPTNTITGKRIFVGNLHPSTTEKELILIFQKFGTIQNIEYIWHKFGPLKGQPKGYAFIEYEQEDSVRNVLQKDRQISLHGRKIGIRLKDHETSKANSNRSYLTLLSKRKYEDDTSIRGRSPVIETVKSIDERILKLKVLSIFFYLNFTICSPFNHNYHPHR